MSSPRKLLVDALSIVFGMSSWVEISGLGVQMPLMVHKLPEGWKLGSYIVVISQFANIGPFLYWIARKFRPPKVLEIPTIHLTLSIACTSCLLLAFFWNKTSFIAGEEHSTALLCLAFCLALVDCTSSVLYLPFMATFREIYVISCMIGEGACGLLPSIVGFIQGVGGYTECNVTTNGTTVPSHIESEPRFSVGVYFVLLFLMVAISWIAFVLLDKLPSIQGEKVCTRKVVDQLEDDSMLRVCENAPEEAIEGWSNLKTFYLLLAVQTYVCIMHNGVLSSIQSFSCLPYGNVVYQLSVNLSLISNPIGCAIALFRPAWTLKSVLLWTVFNSIWAVYILVIALRSPTPPFMESFFGPFMIVTAWVVFVGSVSFIKASIVAIFRRHGGNNALFWGGAMSQVGSGVGGIAMFAIVNYTQLFKSSPTCSS